MVHREHKRRKVMRKLGLTLVLVISVILLMVSPSSAQTPRQPTSSEGKSGFVNISVRGLSKDGTEGFVQPGLPGYVEMVSCAGNVYYLYIGYDGKLRLASELVVGYGASPSLFGWADGASAPCVGDQTEF